MPQLRGTHYPRWTPEEKWLILDALANGVGYEEAAKLSPHNRSVRAVEAMAGAEGEAPRKRGDMYPIKEAARQLGISPILMGKLVRSGACPSFDTGTAYRALEGRNYRLVAPDDLRAFVRDQDSWFMWRESDLAELWLREYAATVRGPTGRYLSVREVGALLGYGPRTIREAIVAGRMQGAWHLKQWWVRADHVVDPHKERHEVYQTYRRFTAAEDSYVRRLWGKISTLELAKRLERPLTSVRDSAKRQGLPRGSTGWRVLKGESGQTVTKPRHDQTYRATAYTPRTRGDGNASEAMKRYEHGYMPPIDREEA